MKRAIPLSHNIKKELQNILSAVDHSSIIVITNSLGKITYVNDQFCEISKHNRADLLGQNLRIIKSGHHSDRFFTELWITISSGHIWKGEIKNRAQDGSFYWTSNTITPSINADGYSIEYVSIQFDISEKKILEDNLNKLKIELHQVTSEREIRELYLSTLSHDLKTPLSIAKISAEIIQKKYTDTDTEKIKNLSTKITNNINRVDLLITGLLDANRSRGQINFPLEFVELDMNNVVLETLENLKTIYGDRFSLETNGNLIGYWSLLGIKRILENLTTNAIKYGDADSPVVVKIKGNENNLILSVQNQGNPISEMDQRIIFDYLQRSTSAESGNQNGWGLGLSIVKGMTEAHGGSIRVFSYAGKDGTTFALTLPKDSRPFTKDKEIQSPNLIMASEGDNYLRLFRHMPEIQVLLSGPLHIFEFVNEAYMDTFGFNPIGMSVRDLGPARENYISIFDEVYSTGIPRTIMKNPIIIGGATRYLNQTFVPRKNYSGNIIGILTISSEVPLN